MACCQFFGLLFLIDGTLVHCPVLFHQTFGGIAFVWMLIQILLGGLSVWFGGAAFGGGAKAKAVWKYHRCAPSSDNFEKP